MPKFFRLKTNWLGVRITLRDLQFPCRLPDVTCERCHGRSSFEKSPYVRREDREEIFGNAGKVSARVFNSRIPLIPVPHAYRAEPVPPSPGSGIDRAHVTCTGMLPDIADAFGSILVSARAREILHEFGAVDEHFTDIVVVKGPEMPDHALFCPPMSVIGKADWRPFTDCPECGRPDFIEGRLESIAKYQAKPDKYGPPDPLPPNPGIPGWRTTPFTPEFWEAVGSPHFFRLFAHGTFAAFSVDLINAFGKLKAVAVEIEPIKLIGYERAGETE